MRRSFLLLSVLWLPLLSHAAYNSSSRGTTAAPFLEMGSGARNAAMGEASTDSRESSTLFTNPAAMTQVNGPAFTLGHSIGFESSFFDIGSGVWSLGKNDALGFGILYSGAGDVIETDDTAVEQGKFSPNDQAASLGWAHKFGFGSLGASAKYIRSTILDSAQTAALDLGAASRGYFNDKLHVELAALNLGGKLKYETESEDLPTNIRAGAAYRFTRTLLLATELVFPKGNNSYLSGGTEWTLAESKTSAVLLRAGFNGRRNKDLNGAGVSGGMGIKLGNWRLDYAFVPYGELGDTHQISISFMTAAEPETNFEPASMAPQPIATETVAPPPPPLPSHPTTMIKTTPVAKSAAAPKKKTVTVKRKKPTTKKKKLSSIHKNK